MKRFSKQLLVLIVVLSAHLPMNAQRPPETFFMGLKNYNSDPALARQQFRQAISEDSTFYGSYNFIGTILDQEKKYDSAIIYLLTAARLNPNNVNHTKEMTLAHLCRTYIHMGNFEAAYKTAIESLASYPDSKYILFQLRATCIWAYNVQYGGLSKSYLDPEVKSSYFVNSVSQEYLVMRNITINNQELKMLGQTYTMDNEDILRCVVQDKKDTIKLVFKLGWDVLKSFVDNMPDYKIVYEDKNAKIWMRLGAIISHDANTDVLKELEKLKN